MNPRNFFSRRPLQSDMTEEWQANNITQLGGLERVTLPGAERVAAPALVSNEERALVERARSGDQDAFALLVRLHQRQVYTLALRMLRDAEEASEATQEVFLAAWQGLRGFRGDARFATWLYRIAYNHCLKIAEQRRRDVAAHAELTAQSAREQGPAQALSASHARDAEQQMRERVRDEIENLPAKYRIVLVLRHLQELSYEEMADVMRVPIGTVKTQLFRARALLKERLEDFGRIRDEGISRANGLRAGLEAGLRTVLEQHGNSDLAAQGRDHTAKEERL
ncbi:MAG: RNA polymerase sigma factor [Ktedonobacterales bacterium]